MYKSKLVLSLTICASLFAGILSGCSNSGSSSGTDSASSAATDSVSSETAGSAVFNKIESEYTFTMPEEAAESTISIKAVDNISDDFIRGMDASSVLSEENSGVKYYNFDGKEQDVFLTLAESGINYIRIRVWNDPYDENGNGYGGGNNDLATAIELGKRATKYGMRVCIDFHYSDFWADPKRQHAPKAWADMDIDEKSTALYEYTVDSLTQLLEAGVDVGMVQIGNEINFGMSDETETMNIMSLLKAGSNGVREVSNTYSHDMDIVVHYTRISQPSSVSMLVSNLIINDVDFDIIGLSYYPFWDGDMENMQSLVEKIQEKYEKQVVIAETSYCYTSEDGDGFDNSLSGTDDLVEGYPATVQGQANMVRDVINAANEAGALGVFYWEGVWIPVGPADQDNSAIWEQYGSGWASSYASDYDPEDAGLYYGGSSWDNQAFFDFDGYPLESLNVFKYLKTGTIADKAIDYIPETNLSYGIDEEIVLPDTVSVLYNDQSTEEATVTWNEDDVAAIDQVNGGTYKVEGTLEDGTVVTANVEIVRPNLVLNSDFEGTNTSMWKVSYEGSTNPTDFQNNEQDAHSGSIAFHYYSADSDMDFSIEQEFTNLEPGTYELSVYAQGGDMAEDAEMELYAVSADGTYSESFMVTSWADWQHPIVQNITVTDGTLTIGVHVKCNATSWGTFDDFTLNYISK